VLGAFADLEVVGGGIDFLEFLTSTSAGDLPY